jgi:signal transduction histidine kinase
MPDRLPHSKSIDFHELFRSLPETILIVKPNFEVVEVTDSFVKAWGKLREEVLGRNILDLFPEPLKENEVARNDLTASLLRCIEKRLPDSIDLRLKSSEKELDFGNPAWRYRTSPVMGGPGQVSYLILSVTCHGENKPQTTRELDETRKSLEAVNKEYEGFAHSVSHDLRAPLRGIDMYAGVISEDYRDRIDDEGKRLLELIRKLTRTMNGYIDDLLSFSRLGRRRLVPGALDMTELARSAFDDLKTKTPTRNVLFELKDLPPAFGDRSLIKQAFSNLLSNALKFTGLRELALIEVTGRSGDDHNTYCVRDNGVGFDPQFAGKLFGIFQRMHSQEEFEGAGAGLALTQRIIQKHGGRIWAESKEGEGATFCFTLPRSMASGLGTLSELGGSKTGLSEK